MRAEVSGGAFAVSRRPSAHGRITHISVRSTRQTRNGSRRAAQHLAALQHRPRLRLLGFPGMFASNDSFKPSHFALGLISGVRW